MSDLRASFFIRVILWVLAIAFVMLLVVLLNLTAEMITKSLFGIEMHSFVQGTVFWAIVCERIWRWLKVRVWVGRVKAN